MLVRLALSVLFLACLDACASPEPVAPSLSSQSLATAPAWPACAPPITDSPAYPLQIAPGFPFPPALALTRAIILHEDSNNVELVGYAPLTLPAAIRWLREQLPQSGYTAVQIDAEADEVEGAITGNGWRGNYWVRPEMTCLAVTEWVLIFRRQ